MKKKNYQRFKNRKATTLKKSHSASAKSSVIREEEKKLPRFKLPMVDDLSSIRHDAFANTARMPSTLEALSNIATRYPRIPDYSKLNVNLGLHAASAAAFEYTNRLHNVTANLSAFARVNEIADNLANINNLNNVFGIASNYESVFSSVSAALGKNTVANSVAVMLADHERFTGFYKHPLNTTIADIGKGLYSPLAYETANRISDMYSNNNLFAYPERIGIGVVNNYSTSLLAKGALVNTLCSTIVNSNNLLQQSITGSIFAADIEKSYSRSIYAERALGAFNWAETGKLIDLDAFSSKVLSSSMLALSTDYAGISKSLSVDPSGLTSIGSTLYKSLSTEFYTSANILETITIEKSIDGEEESLNEEIVYENEYSLATYLPKVHDGLYNMWKGAVETIRSNNSDKARQSITSIRELFTHLIHILAPDNKIKEWSSDPSLYDSNKPTRRARLQYICRNVSSDATLKKFIDADIASADLFVTFQGDAIDLIQTFQRGTHGIDSKFSTRYLRAIQSRAEGFLKFLLEIEFSANR